MVYFLSFSPVIYRHKYTHRPWVFQTRYISKLRKVKTRQHDKAQRVTCEAQEDEKASKSPILHEVSYKRNQKSLTFMMPAPGSAASTCGEELARRVYGNHDRNISNI